MPPYHLTRPLLIVHNYLENFREFLLRTGESETLMDRRFNGDQALFWYGQEKLVISSAPIENLDLLRERWGYQGTRALAPDQPSPILSRDIIRSERLRSAIREHAGPEKKLAIIAYANTIELYELAKVLEEEDGLDIELPESPLLEDLWIKRYMDTKVGFRTQISEWAGDQFPLPQGFITSEISQAAEIVAWFAGRGKGSVVKADQGGSGVGNLFLPLEEVHGVEEVTAHLAENKFLHEGIFIVEEYIDTPVRVSPSIEFYVPKLGEGEARITYLCNQHFEPSGRFAGVIVARELYEASWYPGFRDLGMDIAHHMQAMGYAGHFDLDSILDKDGKPYVVEINSRRTGGTFAHEFMATRYGENYADQLAFISQNKIHTRHPDLRSLEEAASDLLYPIAGAERGVIVALTSTLFRGDFGCIIIGEDITDVTAIQAKLFERL